MSGEEVPAMEEISPEKINMRRRREEMERQNGLYNEDDDISLSRRRRLRVSHPQSSLSLRFCFYFSKHSLFG